MKVVSIIVFCGLLAMVCQAASPADSTAAKKQEISFTADVMPVFKKNCLPCHAEDQYNPSELSLDSHDLTMAGGKHGVPVVPGKPEESLLVQKLGEKPPFGDRMPMDPRKKRGEMSKKKLTDDEVRILSEWIAQGAKNN
jgi:hypothetical protein